MNGKCKIETQYHNTPISTAKIIIVITSNIREDIKKLGSHILLMAMQNCTGIL